MPIVRIADVAQKPIDYVVIGGGTTGLVAAVRLSEDPLVTVLVLEAGEANLGDPLIDIPLQLGDTFGNPQYDWAFMTAKQKNINDREIFWARGKGLGERNCMSSLAPLNYKGGSSSTNFYAWIKPPAADVNALEKLGNPGWNWSEYEKYSKKSETFHPPKKDQTDLYPHTFDLSFRGSSGPVQVTIPDQIHTVDRLFQETMVNSGLKAINDPYGGDINGTWIASSNLDPRTWTRSSSASAYLVPNIDRPNLKVLTGALVSRIIFDLATTGKERTATAVEFIHGHENYEVNVEKEVILSAGAVNSPQILELSGIGQPEVLTRVGIDVEIDLPGVGENVQEHTAILTIYELDPRTPHETWDRLLDPAFAAKTKALYTAGQGMQRGGLTSFSYFPLSLTNPDKALDLINKLEEEVDAKQKGMTPGLEEQLRLQISALRDDTIPDCEIAIIPGFFLRTTSLIQPEIGKSYVTPMAIQSHPISRGSIHVESKDPATHPKIDPKYFESNTDLEILVQHIKFLRTMRDVEPWKSGILREVLPGPGCDSDDDIRDFIKNNFGSCFHTIGSCSMLPRSKGGVVDPKLKVYDTTNLRVADISVIPLHFAAHSQATAYVIGEKVADLIKADLKK
ncbi:hypothetical protein GALMADRAFT_155158 [Galerina marginata CBS 339.88]|uniref:pyranose dehydrogenase (acceptor) n=1 Tax=Galerina marginata (strain CBS 339.88) TaxID=685588 RepID=A0A067T4V7_GALM3|nr:hypothetical protein GALMADRAFT_155158 [Galerina marginata CBS 339.88]